MQNIFPLYSPSQSWFRPSSGTGRIRKIRKSFTWKCPSSLNRPQNSLSLVLGNLKQSRRNPTSKYERHIKYRGNQGQVELVYQNEKNQLSSGLHHSQGNRPRRLWLCPQSQSKVHRFVQSRQKNQKVSTQQILTLKTFLRNGHLDVSWSSQHR